MSDSKIRVIQWATGSVGKIAIRHFVDNPAYELVGVYVHSPEKHGLDAGLLAESNAIGLAATNNVEDILALDANCVNYSPMSADPDEMVRILESGKNITTSAGFIFPGGLEAGARDKIEQACRKAGVSVHGAGVHPGFAGDILPLTYARLCSRVDRIVVEEMADMAPHPSAGICFDLMGFGRTVADFRANPMPLFTQPVSVFRESMLLLADGLGIPVDDTTIEWDVAAAKRDLHVTAGLIPEGTVAGMRVEWTIWSSGVPAIVFRSLWIMDDDLEPAWDFSTVKYSLFIDGDPAIRVAFEPGRKHATGDEGYWGRMWTAMNVVNAIPATIAAEPGIRSHLDLPFIQPKGLFRPQMTNALPS